ncbi:hypothetical protein CXB51_030962 [Gossypium anomalum]|uniref:NECAP PHear domain-containing protein n=1 Tax=Gossypium anomalum TaxID=47600 RepID=A0A8J5XY81_9ROSI|nr:hypothetical protein CXB51_030962 [Gossypium anomalum]
MMEKGKEPAAANEDGEVGKAESEEIQEALEIVLFQVSECYVYLIPPRKTAASYRADEWNVNKWAWEGTLKVISKGEECIIRLEDKNTGELYARAFLRDEEPHPVESVIDSNILFFGLRRILHPKERRNSFYVILALLDVVFELRLHRLVLCISPCGCVIKPDAATVFKLYIYYFRSHAGGRLRHAFIGIGFRERTEAYDFQAALHDHMKYLNKKKTAEEMEQQFQKSSSVDYSLKEGETIKGGSTLKSKAAELGIDKLSLADKGNQKEPILSIKPPPPPQTPLSPVASALKSPQPHPPAQLSPVETTGNSPTSSPPDLQLDGTSEKKASSEKEHRDEQLCGESQSTEDIDEDDFGDFQAAG